MKTIKKIITVIVIIAALVAVMGIIAPKEYNIERSVYVNADKDLIFSQISNLKNAEKWSPWSDYDPDMITTFEGEDGTVGSKSKWVGNEEVGKGEQVITKIEDGSRVEVEITFIEPWEAVNTGYTNVEQAGDSVKVTWGFVGSNPFPGNIMALFMNMDDMLGKDFEKGLGKLKTLCENMPKPEKLYHGLAVNEFLYSAKKFIGNRKVVSFADMPAYFHESFTKMSEGIMKSGKYPVGAPCGFFYSYDTEAQTSDMAAVMPVPSDDFSLDGFETILLDTSKALMITYYGSYEKIGEAHMAMDEYMAERSYTQKTPVIEEYITDPMAEPDTAKWQTNVIYFYE